MPELRVRHFVPYTPEQMFDVVADIESYPQFVPYCASMQVLSRAAQRDVETVMARMRVRYKFFSEQYVSKIALNRKAFAIDVAQAEGPFKQLVNTWRFAKTGEGTQIDFYLNYEFRAHGLNLVMRGFFQKLFRNFDRAFEERAQALHA